MNLERCGAWLGASSHRNPSRETAMEDQRGRLLFWPAVRERVGISRTTAWRLQRAGAFPLPVIISPGRVGWREEDITAWSASLAKRRLERRALADGADTPAAAEPSPAGPIETALPLQFAPRHRRNTAPSQQLGFDF